MGNVFKQIHAMKQSLYMSTKLENAIKLLEVPSSELLDEVNNQLVDNPLFDLSTKPPQKKEYMRSQHDSFSSQDAINLFLASEESPTEQIISQILSECSRQDIDIARIILSHMDANGCCPYSIGYISKKHQIPFKDCYRMQHVISRVYPGGLCMPNLQHVLLCQLSINGLENTILYRSIRDCYDLYLENKLLKIAQHLGVTMGQLTTSIHNHRHHLSPNPLLHFKSTRTDYIYPDVVITQDVDDTSIALSPHAFVDLQPNERYRSWKNDNNNDKNLKKYLDKQWNNGQWIVKSIETRNQTLMQIARFICKKQRLFFSNQ